MEGPETIEIVVVKTPKGYVVRPAYVIARRGDTLLWHNLTGEDPEKPIADKEAIQIDFPASETFKVEPRGQRAFAVAIPKGAAYGFHAYSVYSKRAQDFCKGESTPGVIIKG